MAYSIHFIHINNPIRNEYALPKIERLASMQPGCHTQGHSFEGTGPNADASIFSVLRRELKLFFLEQRFRRDVLGKNSRTDVQTLVAFKNHIKHYVFSSERRKKKSKQCSIERLNLDQHLRALGSFLDTDSSHGVFFEDDIVFTQWSEDFFRKAISNNFFNSDYIDLAGGINIKLEAVGGKIQDFSVKINESFETHGFGFSRIFTNTSCGYVLSRRLAAKLYEVVRTSPMLRLDYPVDWLYNSVFMGREFNDDNFVGIHFSPTPFLHGSKVQYDNPWRV